MKELHDFSDYLSKHFESVKSRHLRVITDAGLYRLEDYRFQSGQVNMAAYAQEICKFGLQCFLNGDAEIVLPEAPKAEDSPVKEEQPTPTPYSTLS